MPQLAPSLAMHEPEQHSWSAAHVSPHAPQFDSSTERSTHESAHATRGDLHWTHKSSSHTPLQHSGAAGGQSLAAAHSTHVERYGVRMHTGFGSAQTVPHRPQFSTSPNGMSTHVPLQHVAACAVQSAFDAQPKHVPFEQIGIESGQGAPHSPQLALDELTSTHAPPQQDFAPEQLTSAAHGSHAGGRHALHASPRHAFWQQCGFADGQSPSCAHATQCPSKHAGAGAEQTRPHVPQLAASAELFVHEPLQHVGRDAAQSASPTHVTQIDDWHSGASAGQAVPQLPQLCESVVASMQSPPQHVFPAAQSVVEAQATH